MHRIAAADTFQNYTIIRLTKPAPNDYYPGSIVVNGMQYKIVPLHYNNLSVLEKPIDTIAVQGTGLYVGQKVTFRTTEQFFGDKPCDKCNQLAKLFYGGNIESGFPELSATSELISFLIVEHKSESRQIKPIVKKLLEMNCREFVFWGKQANTWHNDTDIADIDIHPNEDDWALTSDWDQIDDFIDSIALALSSRERINTTVLLFYDDVHLFLNVLELLDKYSEFELNI